MSLPKDPILLLSFVNTKLRDEFKSLDDFCEEFLVEKCDIEKSLETVGYFYDENANSFK